MVWNKILSERFYVNDIHNNDITGAQLQELFWTNKSMVNIFSIQWQRFQE